MTSRIDDRILQAISKRISINSKEVSLAKRNASVRLETLSRAYRKEAEGVSLAQRSIASRARLRNVPPEEKLRDLAAMRRLLAEQQRCAQATGRVLKESRGELARLGELQRTLETQGKSVAFRIDNNSAIRQERCESSEADDLSILSAIKERVERDQSAVDGESLALMTHESVFTSQGGSAPYYDISPRRFNESGGEKSERELYEHDQRPATGDRSDGQQEDSPQLSLQYRSTDGEETEVSLALEKNGTVSVDFNCPRTSSPWVNSRRERRFAEALERVGIGVDHVSIVNCRESATEK